MNKLSNFQSFVYTSNFNILCITETWLTDSVFDLEILPTDFTIYRKDRHSRGGGVLIAVDESIPTSIIPSPTNIEVISVKIELSQWFNLFVHPNVCLARL